MPELFDEVRLVKMLLDIPLFEDLDYTQISEIIQTGTQRIVHPGEVLCKSRTIDERLLILLDGKLCLESAEGQRFADMTPVRVIGEMGVFTGQTRSSRVVAEGAAVILELLAVDLQDLVEEDPQIGNHMLASLIKMLYTRLHDVNEEVEVLHSLVDRLRERVGELSPGDAVLSELFPEHPLDPDV